MTCDYCSKTCIVFFVLIIVTVIPYTLRYSDLFRNKVLHYKANYILYNYFTEITSGVGTFGGASQSAFRNQCWTAG